MNFFSFLNWFFLWKGMENYYNVYTIDNIYWYKTFSSICKLLPSTWRGAILHVLSTRETFFRQSVLCMAYPTWCNAGLGLYGKSVWTLCTWSYLTSIPLRFLVQQSRKNDFPFIRENSSNSSQMRRLNLLVHLLAGFPLSHQHSQLVIWCGVPHLLLVSHTISCHSRVVRLTSTRPGRWPRLDQSESRILSGGARHPIRWEKCL